MLVKTSVPFTTSKNMQKKLLCKRLLVLTELLNTNANGFAENKSGCKSQVLVVAELFVSETRYKLFVYDDVMISLLTFFLSQKTRIN